MRFKISKMDKIYKNDEIYTPEQQVKIDKLAELKFWDVLKVYRKWCEEQNWTDEWRMRHERGLFEGVGMDEDL